MNYKPYTRSSVYSSYNLLLIKVYEISGVVKIEM